MKSIKTLNIVALAFTTLLCASCSNNGGGAASTAEVPAECDRYFRSMSVCSINGGKASQQEADEMYKNLSQGWKDGVGSGSMSAEECKTAAELIEVANRTNC